MIKIIFTIISIFLVISIAIESLGWALVIGALLFCILCWLNDEPDSCRKKRIRNQRINAAQNARDMHDLISQK